MKPSPGGRASSNIHRGESAETGLGAHAWHGISSMGWHLSSAGLVHDENRGSWTLEFWSNIRVSLSCLESFAGFQTKEVPLLQVLVDLLAASESLKVHGQLVAKLRVDPADANTPCP